MECDSHRLYKLSILMIRIYPCRGTVILCLLNQGTTVTLTGKAMVPIPKTDVSEKMKHHLSMKMVLHVYDHLSFKIVC